MINQEYKNYGEVDFEDREIDMVEEQSIKDMEEFERTK